jgi:hypothetical protein
MNPEGIAFGMLGAWRRGHADRWWRVDVSALVPCPSCKRHVRESEAACPFCAATRRVARPESRAVAGAARGLSRAALFALGSVAVTACFEEPSAVPFYGSPPTGDVGTAPEGPGGRFKQDAGAGSADTGALDATDDASDANDASDDADAGVSDGSPDA